MAVSRWVPPRNRQSRTFVGGVALPHVAVGAVAALLAGATAGDTGRASAFETKPAPVVGAARLVLVATGLTFTRAVGSIGADAVDRAAVVHAGATADAVLGVAEAAEARTARAAATTAPGRRALAADAAAATEADVAATALLAGSSTAHAGSVRALVADDARPGAEVLALALAARLPFAAALTAASGRKPEAGAADEATAVVADRHAPVVRAAAVAVAGLELAAGLARRAAGHERAVAAGGARGRPVGVWPDTDVRHGIETRAGEARRAVRARRLLGLAARLAVVVRRAHLAGLALLADGDADLVARAAAVVARLVRAAGFTDGAAADLTRVGRDVARQARARADLEGAARLALLAAGHAGCWVAVLARTRVAGVTGDPAALTRTAADVTNAAAVADATVAAGLAVGAARPALAIAALRVRGVADVAPTAGLVRLAAVLAAALGADIGRRRAAAVRAALLVGGAAVTAGAAVAAEPVFALATEAAGLVAGPARLAPVGHAGGAVVTAPANATGSAHFAAARAVVGVVADQRVTAHFVGRPADFGLRVAQVAAAVVTDVATTTGHAVAAAPRAEAGVAIALVTGDAVGAVSDAAIAVAATGVALRAGTTRLARRAARRAEPTPAGGVRVHAAQRIAAAWLARVAALGAGPRGGGASGIGLGARVRVAARLPEPAAVATRPVATGAADRAGAAVRHADVAHAAAPTIARVADAARLAGAAARHAGERHAADGILSEAVGVRATRLAKTAATRADAIDARGVRHGAPVALAARFARPTAVHAGAVDASEPRQVARRDTTAAVLVRIAAHADGAAGATVGAASGVGVATVGRRVACVATVGRRVACVARHDSAIASQGCTRRAADSGRTSAVPLAAPASGQQQARESNGHHPNYTSRQHGT